MKNNVQAKKKIPTFSFVLLAIGIIWLLNELKVWIVDIPWLPIVMIIIAVSWIYQYYKE